MSWLTRYRIRAFWSSSFWVFPSIATFAAIVVAYIIRWVDDKTRWTLFDMTPDGARSILGAFSASMLTFIVFVLSAMLIVVQLASAQLTPRIIAIFFARRHVKFVATVFTFSFAYTVGANSRISDHVPQLPAAFALLCNLTCIPLFFYFANRIAVDLRPVSILTAVGISGSRMIDAIYPRRFEGHEAEPAGTRSPMPQLASEIVYSGPPGTVLAFSPSTIRDLAVRADAIVWMVPQVGDFIARGDPLFRVTPGALAGDDSPLRDCVAVGPERTLEQDPAFAFRIIVDIANRALSAAINDPTTAVLAIDQIHRLLLKVGGRRLDEGELRGADGTVRLLYGTPDWTDFVRLGVSEIRHYGEKSIQIARRLLAMLGHLIQVLPAARHAPLQLELALLHRSVQRAFQDEEDRDHAEVPDFQGMGGAEPDVHEPSTTPPLDRRPD